MRETPASLRMRSLSADLPMEISSPSKRKRRPRPRPEAIQSAKAISEPPAEDHLVGDGSEEHQEEGREDEADQREEQLDRRLVGQLLRALRALGSHLRGEDAQHLAERRAHAVRLDERVHEGGDGGNAYPRREIAQRLFARLSQLELL